MTKKRKSVKSKAIFLDRDGVLNYPVLNPNTNAYEAPFKAEDLKLFPWVIESLIELQILGFKLFIVTNQPDFAKKKATLENINLIRDRMLSIYKENNIVITEYYACFHHPNGVIPEYTMKCECRKPGNLFLKEAIKKYDLDPKECWMIGDRDTDIECGQSIGAKTILIHNEHSINEKTAGKSNPEFKAKDLKIAVEIIKSNR